MLNFLSYPKEFVPKFFQIKFLILFFKLLQTILPSKSYMMTWKNKHFLFSTLLSNLNFENNYILFCPFFGTKSHLAGPPWIPSCIIWGFFEKSFQKKHFLVLCSALSWRVHRRLWTNYLSSHPWKNYPSASEGIFGFTWIM